MGQEDSWLYSRSVQALSVAMPQEKSQILLSFFSFFLNVFFIEV